VMMVGAGDGGGGDGDGDGGIFGIWCHPRNLVPPTKSPCTFSVGLLEGQPRFLIEDSKNLGGTIWISIRIF
ncbi:MAG: hypothetical protein AAF989_10290, partial [Planctomycetota bacterium]